MALEVFMAIVIALARWRGVYGEQDGVWPWIPDAHGRQRAYPWTTFIILVGQDQNLMMIFTEIVHVRW